MSFPKTLIIGLGGFGSDVVVSTYQRFMNHSIHEDDRAKVRFLALDTDSNEVYYRRQIMAPEDVIQTSATNNVVAGRYIEEIKDNSTVEQWFPTHIADLRKMAINDGAGQIRYISRLALSHAIHKGKLDRLENAINELLSLNAGDGNNIQVNIVSSLAGGTGAGSYLQMAYYVREILSRAGINSPTVVGYFLLGDVFLKDPSINLSDINKQTSILANTYACLKELNSIYEIQESQSIDFEYGQFTATPFKIDSNSSTPYTQCFLYDFENREGNNISSVKNYKTQMEDFLYLNSFSPTGAHTRSEAINNIFNQIRSGDSSRFASSGISKIVYPIDNLLNYFSVKRLGKNLTETWLKIDQKFDEKYKEYQDNINKGILSEEPQLSPFFRTNVDSLANNGSGTEQAIFKQIQLSTKVIDSERQEVIGKKTDFLVHEIQNYLLNLRDRDEDIYNYSQVHHNDSFVGKEDDESNDINNIREVEDQLDALTKEVFSFIEDNKRLAVEEIFIKDVTSYKNVTEVKHRINTYVLEKDKAMHPLAQRYFFYELLDNLEQIVAILKQQNNKTLASINLYSEVFDVKDDNGDDATIESPIDAYRIYTSEQKGVFNKVKGLFGKSSSLKEFKEDYVTKSKKQARILNEYALDKLTEFVFEGLISQIKIMIDNLERLFKTIPGVIVGLTNAENALLKEGSFKNSSSIQVLSEKKHRDHIYEQVIAKRDSIFFPEEMSRNMYEELFARTCMQIEKPSYLSLANENRIKDIFEKLVVNKQIEQFRKKFSDDFAGYNVIQAMRKEAEMGGEDPLQLMKRKCSDAIKRATPFGANFGQDDPKINAWALHPECMEYQYLTADDAATIFNTGETNQENARTVISPYFDKTELIREESVMVLALPNNFPKFGPVDPDVKYSVSKEGVYYTAYKRRIKETQENINLPTPHLDKRWLNPALFRDIGLSSEAYQSRIIKAFIWGLVHADIIAFNDHGHDVWAYNSVNGRGLQKIRGNNGKPIKAKVKALITEGLWNNEQMVNDIIQKADQELQSAKEVWSEINTGSRSIKTLRLVKSLKDFRIYHKGTQHSLLSVFDNSITSNDTATISFLFDELINTMIVIYGNKGKDTQDAVVKIAEEWLSEIPESGVQLSRQLLQTTLENRLRNAFTE